MLLFCKRKKQPSNVVMVITTVMVIYLSHCHSPLLSEGVVVEVDDTKACVVLQSFGQRRHTRMIDAVLRHVNFFQSADQLKGVGELESLSTLFKGGD